MLCYYGLLNSLFVLLKICNNGYCKSITLIRIYPVYFVLYICIGFLAMTPNKCRRPSSSTADRSQSLAICSWKMTIHLTAELHLL